MEYLPNSDDELPSEPGHIIARKVVRSHVTHPQYPNLSFTQVSLEVLDEHGNILTLGSEKPADNDALSLRRPRIEE